MTTYRMVLYETYCDHAGCNRCESLLPTAAQPRKAEWVRAELRKMGWLLLGGSALCPDHHGHEKEDTTCGS